MKVREIHVVIILYYVCTFWLTYDHILEQNSPNEFEVLPKNTSFINLKTSSNRVQKANYTVVSLLVQETSSWQGHQASVFSYYLLLLNYTQILSKLPSPPEVREIVVQQDLSPAQHTFHL